MYCPAGARVSPSLSGHRPPVSDGGGYSSSQTPHLLLSDDVSEPDPERSAPDLLCGPPYGSPSDGLRPGTPGGSESYRGRSVLLTVWVLCHRGPRGREGTSGDSKVNFCESTGGWGRQLLLSLHVYRSRPTTVGPGWLACTVLGIYRGRWLEVHGPSLYRWVYESVTGRQRIRPPAGLVYCACGCIVVGFAPSQGTPVCWG